MINHQPSSTERKRAETALRESEHRFRTLCRYAPVGIFLADPQGDGVFVNDRICEMAGRMPEELRGKGWSRAVHPEDRERFFNEWYNAAKAGREFAGECRFQTPQGKITWLHANAVALRNDAGEITGYLGTLTDVSERKEAEEALRRYEHIVAGTTDFMAFIDRDYKYQAINQSYLQAFGKKREEIIGRTGEALFGTEVFEEFLRPYLGRCLAGEEVFYEAWLDFPVRGRRYMDVHYNPSREADGSIAGIVVSARDITERKEAEEALRETEARLQLAIKASNTGLWDWDLRMNQVYLSPEWKKQLGYEDHEIPNRVEEWKRRLHPEDLDRILATLKAYHEHPWPDYEVVFRLRHKDGSYRWILTHAALFRDVDGKPCRMLGSHVDITERKQAEEALRRAIEELERGVQERTVQLSKAIGVLEEQIAERHAAEEELRSSREQLRALSRRLLSVQEEERSRIAREVHDELGQALTALKIDLAWVAQRLAASQEPLQKKTERMTQLVDTTVQAVRRISTELRPRVLDHLGLVAALEWQVREFQDRTGIGCVFTRKPEEISVDGVRATTVFRICQEALTNVSRHANATRVDLNLRKVGPDLVLEVRDNGRGVTKEAVANPNSLGLIGMRERVLPWGGDISIKGFRGKGSVVTVRIPVRDGEGDLTGDVT